MSSSSSEVVSKGKSCVDYDYEAISVALNKVLKEVDGHLICSLTEAKKIEERPDTLYVPLSNIQIKGCEKSSARWYYISQNKKDIPKKTYLRSQCRVFACVSHHQLVYLELTRVEQMSDDDFSSARQMLKKNSKPMPNGCLNWIRYLDTSGYGSVKYSKIHKNVHIFSWEVEHKKSVPQGMQMRHLCGNPSCILPAHLVPGTAKENAQDKKDHGTHLFGELHQSAKITEDMAKRVIESKGQGTQCERANRLGISQGIVVSIDACYSWRHLRSPQELQKADQGRNVSQKRKREEIFGEQRESDNTYLEETRKRIWLGSLLLRDDLDQKEHWLWEGGSNNGCPVMCFKGVQRQVCRVSWYVHNKGSTIGESRRIRHICKYKACVNPACLQLVVLKKKKIEQKIEILD